jgi:nucleoside-diphosphate-sugar epimerase
VPALVYVSAAASPPLVPSRYLTSKRAAESTIAAHFPSLRAVFARPAFMYDASRAFTLPVAAAARAASAANGLVGGLLSPLMGAGGMRPMKADDVADAVVEAVEDGEVRGVVDVEGLERLAAVAWRKGML